jgi:hypothetical protein
VRGVRKASKRDRRFRPGVLAALAFLAGVLLFSSCSRPPAKPPSDPRASFYGFADGKLQSITDLVAQKQAIGLPWTVQTRIADEAYDGETLYFAVNGRGIASVSIPSSGAPDFQYFYDDMIFAHRTVTSLVPRQDGLTIHLYFNELLNTIAPSELALRGFGLVRYSVSSKEFGFLIPPFQKSHSTWEPVGFLAAGPDDFWFEWKHVDGGETSFAYIRFNAATGGEVPASRDDYLAALRASSTTANRGSRPALVSLVGATLGSLPSDTAIHFTFRSASSHREIFRSAEGATSVVSVSVFEDGTLSYALLPGGKVLSVSAGELSGTIQLPALPEGFIYTDLVKVGDFLFVPWEQTRFTDVGGAGLLLYSLAKGSN